VTPKAYEAPARREARDLKPAKDAVEGLRIAREAANRLQHAYGERLVEVVLFGPWAREEAHGESDVDLLIVLDEVAARLPERDRVVDALCDLEADSGRAIEAFSVAVADVSARRRPFVRSALTKAGS
jgi:predicted nucleotidyltransferase